MKPNEEKKCLSDIKNMKATLPFAEKIEALKP